MKILQLGWPLSLKLWEMVAINAFWMLIVIYLFGLVHSVLPRVLLVPFIAALFFYGWRMETLPPILRSERREIVAASALSIAAAGLLLVVLAIPDESGNIIAYPADAALSLMAFYLTLHGSFKAHSLVRKLENRWHTLIWELPR